jgi:hypothetical protein
LVEHQIEYFIQKELFTWQWWFLLALSILPWVLWLVIRDKQRQGKLLLGGISVGLIAVIADVTGSQAGFWFYCIKLIPSIPPLLPYDLSLMPVSFMLIQQYTKKRWQRYMVFAIFSVGTAFLIEPVLELMKVYTHVSWKHYYSVPVYFAIMWMGSKMYDL